MKFRVQFKTRGVLIDAIAKLCINPIEVKSMASSIDLMSQYVGKDESIVIEFDTDAQTAVVVPVKP